MKYRNLYILFSSLLNNRIWGVILFPLSVFYRAAVFLKNLSFDKKIKIPSRVKSKIISIGNISVGGTGKTPLVNTLTSILVKAGYRTAVVSRGYGGKGKGTICVSNGENILSSAEECGDEPLLLATKLPGIPVVTGADRIQSARLAEKKFQPEVIILDDGFQHRKLHRDIDIITINATNPRGNGMLLPAGPLREPWKNLQRSDVVVITHSDKTTGTRSLQSAIGKYSPNPIFLSCHRPISFTSLSHDKIPLPSLENQPVLAFAGIANPDSFRQSLLDIGCVLKKYIVFPDHHYYTDSDKKEIMQNALLHQVKAIISTEKDMVRIRQWTKIPVPLYFLKIELTFGDELPEFQKCIENKLKKS